MEIYIPDFVLLLLVGPSGSGKTHFATHYFPADTIVSQRQIQTLLGDDGRDPGLQEDAFKFMHKAIELRLKHRKACIVDADLLTQESRKELVKLSRRYHCKIAAVVFDFPAEVCIERNVHRKDGDPGVQIVRTQIGRMARIDAHLTEEGIKTHFKVTPAHLDEGIDVKQHKMRSDKKHDHGPFDIVGDIHGCFDELVQLLGDLGYGIESVGSKLEVGPNFKVTPPEGRKLIFVGDLVDRGPDSPRVMRLVMDAVNARVARCVPGNHDDKLLRYLRGNKVQLRHGLEKTVVQLEGVDSAFLEEVQTFIDRLSSHLELDGGALVVAHAGLKLTMHGRSSGEVHAFCLYGETTGETDEFGLPVRHNWAGEYEGKSLVVYGHTPVPEPIWQKNTVNIDTGCVFGGMLTALRYPEREIVSVPAIQMHSQPLRPLHWNTPKAAAAKPDETVNFDMLNHRALVSTRHGYHLTLTEQQASLVAEIAGLETVDPKWLIYLPPTVSPPTSASLPGLLEHPAQAFDYYRKKNLIELLAYAQPIGTKVVMVLCKNESAAIKRFGIADPGHGTLFTRTGRPYFTDRQQEQQFLKRLAEGLEIADVWKELKTDWICVEAVAVPLAHKAEGFIDSVYGTVVSSARQGLGYARARLQAGIDRGLDLAETMGRIETQQASLASFESTVLRLHAQEGSALVLHLTKVIATEGSLHAEAPHPIQQNLLLRLAFALPVQLVAVERRLIELDSENSQRETVAWWETLNHQLVEGIVLEPNGLFHEKNVELIQASMKVRTREYLRMVYGVSYDAPASLDVWRDRSLKLKRETAVREYSLGLEAVSRFLERQPWGNVFQCTFTLLGLESMMGDLRV